MTENSRIVIRDGKAVGVYSDAAREFMEAIGDPVVERASDVEHDDVKKEWKARLRKTGAVIAHGRNRSAVISEEIAWLEARL